MTARVVSAAVLAAALTGAFTPPTHAQRGGAAASSSLALVGGFLIDGLDEPAALRGRNNASDSPGRAEARRYF